MNVKILCVNESNLLLASIWSKADADEKIAISNDIRELFGAKGKVGFMVVNTVEECECGEIHTAPAVAIVEHVGLTPDGTVSYLPDSYFEDIELVD